VKEWILQRRWRIIVSGIFITALPLLSLAFIINFQITIALEDRIIKETQWFAKISSHHLEDTLDREISLGKSFATRPQLLTAINRDDKKEMTRHLKTLVDSSGSLERVFIATPQGIQIANYPATTNTLGKDFTERDWYKGVSRNWEPYVSEFYIRAAKPQHYLFAMAVPFRLEGRVIGILVMQPKEDYIGNAAREIDIGIGQIYVVDRKGHLIYHPRFTVDRIMDFSREPLVQKVLKGLDGAERTLDSFGKEPAISAYHPVAPWGWGVVVEKPTAVILAPVRKITLWLAAITGSMLLLGAIFAYRWAEILSESQKLTQDLKRYADKLENANNELESFSYSISHDLRSPLRAIDGFSRILLKEYGAKIDSEGKRLLDIVRTNAQRMGQLIDDLLAFSRVGRAELRLSEINMQELANKVCEELKAGMTGQTVQCIVGSLPTAFGDRAMMRQVFSNLLANAIKFTRTREKARIEVDGREAENENVYSVRDNGVGFDAQYGHKLFGVFQRLHDMDEFEGTGIGLSIVKRIVQKHDGRVWAEGAPDQGAVFYFALPRRLPTRPVKGEGRQ
jgi:signal transduction histidine kinase